jgi:hypothetical protein
LVPIGNETVEWFCEEFLSVVDSPSLFTTAFSELLVEKKWKQDMAARGIASSDLDKFITSTAEESGVVTADEGWQEELVLAQRNPGILIAVFMGNWVCELSRGGAGVENHELLQHFLASLLSRVSVCNSSQAVKWIMRCFSFPVVQTCLLRQNEEKGIFNISSTSLHEIRTLVKVTKCYLL